MSASNTTSASPHHHEPSTLSLGELMGLVFGVSILAMVLVLGCYICYRRKREELEHRVRTAEMNGAYEDAVEDERKRDEQYDNDKWGSYGGNGGGGTTSLQVQRETY